MGTKLEDTYVISTDLTIYAEFIKDEAESVFNLTETQIEIISQTDSTGDECSGILYYEDEELVSFHSGDMYLYNFVYNEIGYDYEDMLAFYEEFKEAESVKDFVDVSYPCNELGIEASDLVVTHFFDLGLSGTYGEYLSAEENYLSMILQCGTFNSGDLYIVAFMNSDSSFEITSYGYADENGYISLKSYESGPIIIITVK